MKIDELSIVIIGLNEELFLEKCIKSAIKLINKTVLTKSEIIYVDSGSTDKSIEVAKNSADKLFILTESKSASAARKVGELNASYKYILFLDGDMEVNENFINEVNSYYLSNNYNKNDKGFMGLRDDINYTADGKNIINSIKNSYNTLKIKKVNHIGGAILIEKEKLLEVGGYDPSQVRAEEPLLLINLFEKNYDIVDIAKPFIVHHNNKSYTLDKKISLALLPHGGSYYYGMLLLKVFKLKKFKGFYKVFKFTFLTWLLNLSLFFSIFNDKFFLVSAILFIIIVKKKYKLLLTANLKIYGFFLFLFSKKKNFIFKYKELTGYKN